MESLLRAFGGAALLRSLVIPALPFVLDDAKLPSTSRVEVKQVVWHGMIFPIHPSHSEFICLFYQDNVSSSAEESSEKREISHKSGKQTAKIMEQGGAGGPPGLDFVNDAQLSHIDAVGMSALSCLRLMIAMAGPLLTPVRLCILFTHLIVLENIVFLSPIVLPLIVCCYLSSSLPHTSTRLPAPARIIASPL
jgi:hypothetical protein